jgi:hypothetical protein
MYFRNTVIKLSLNGNTLFQDGIHSRHRPAWPV